MRIVAFSGNLGSGKDTAAEILVERGWKIVALADRIKQLAALIFGFDRDTLFGPSALRNVKRPDLAKDPAYWVAARTRAYAMKGQLEDLFKNAATVNGFPYESFMDLMTRLEQEPDIFSARHVLQQMGTEWGRHLWDGVWVNALGDTITAIKQGSGYDRFAGLTPAEIYVEPPVGVVPVDCRFLNEIDAILEWGGEVYWIDASVRCPRDLSLAMNTHASEPTSPDDFGGKLTGVIDNNGTLEQLRGKILTLSSANT